MELGLPRKDFGELTLGRIDNESNTTGVTFFGERQRTVIDVGLFCGVECHIQGRLRLWNDSLVLCWQEGRRRSYRRQP